MASMRDPRCRIEEEISSLFAVLHQSSSPDGAEEPAESWSPLVRYLEPAEPIEVEEDCALDDIRNLSRKYRQLQTEPRRARLQDETGAVRPADVHEALRRLLTPPPARPEPRWPGTFAAAVLAIAVAGAAAALFAIPMPW